VSLRESENDEARRLEREVAAWRALLTADSQVADEHVKTANALGRTGEAWENIGVHNQAVLDEEAKITEIQEAGAVTRNEAQILAHIQLLEARITQLLQRRIQRLLVYLEENLPAIRQACGDLQEAVQNGRGVTPEERLLISVQEYPQLDHELESFRTKQQGAEPLKHLEIFLEMVRDVRSQDVRNVWSRYESLLGEFISNKGANGSNS